MKAGRIWSEVLVGACGEVADYFLALGMKIGYCGGRVGDKIEVVDVYVLGGISDGTQKYDLPLCAFLGGSDTAGFSRGVGGRGGCGWVVVGAGAWGAHFCRAAAGTILFKTDAETDGEGEDDEKKKAANQ